MIGFIGMGNMGYAVLKGALSRFSKEDIVFYSKTRTKREKVYSDTGVEYMDSNSSVVKNSKIIILAIKPQVFGEILPEIKEYIDKDKIIISLAAGISISGIKDVIGEDKRVVRAMPNMPALVGEGMTGLSYDEALFTEDEIELIEDIFRSLGKYITVDEKLIDAFICTAGSSPAFAYMFINSLADVGVKYGLSRKEAIFTAAQALLGSAKMVLETDIHPMQLKDMVCSPQGTTIAAVEALQENGFENAILKAGKACYDRSKEMEKH